MLTALIVRKTETLQSTVEQHYSDLAERASDTLGNIALVQSFSRLEAEVAELRHVVERLLSAQMPVLSWWALANVLTRTATTLTVLAIIIVGTLLTIQGKATVGEMVTFMNFAGLIIARLEHSVSFINSVVSEAPSLREFFTVWDTFRPFAITRTPSIPAGCAASSNSSTFHSRMTASGWPWRI